MWLEDSRFQRGRGRIETRFVTRAADASAAAIEVPGNGSRLSLIVAAIPTAAATVTDSVAIGPRQNGQLRPLRVLTVGVAHCALKLDADGDAILGPVSILSTAEWSEISVYETVWHPEGQ